MLYPFSQIYGSVRTRMRNETATREGKDSLRCLMNILNGISKARITLAGALHLSLLFTTVELAKSC